MMIDHTYLHCVNHVAEGTCQHPTSGNTCGVGACNNPLAFAM